ncbi:MAG TPA: NADP-dependent oxidoreductase [Kiritimatiellia bacterium]|nr:NADP-dependent oxidoreductase [Kiritimatiellia bacterium]
MKAIALDHFGGPDVLALRELPDPQPGPGEVRIRIHAAGVNPVDWKIREGLLQGRLPHAFPLIPGWDAAGLLDAVAPDVTDLQPGDAVYAYCRKPVIQHGAYAESITLPATSVARKPANATFEQAASIPLAALTAYQSLHDAGQLAGGQTVLIHAGSGGVGGFAIQLAKHAGATVIATASAPNHPYLRELGADHTIDYTTTDFRDAVRDLVPGGVDLAYDTVGGDVQTRSADIVKPGGTLVSILAFADEPALQARGIQTRYVFVAPNATQLNDLAQRFDQGRFTTRLATVLPLEQAAEAHRLIQTGRTVGKIVLQVGK